MKPWQCKTARAWSTMLSRFAMRNIGFPNAPAHFAKTVM
jgi:hypothetical protein